MLHGPIARVSSLSLLAFVLTLGALQTDAQVGPPPAGPPLILFFSGTVPATVTVSGTPASLSYVAIGNPPPTCSVDNGIGTIPCSGNFGQSTDVFVYPAITTTYTLTATNSYGSDTARATVVVLPLPPNPPGPGLLTTLPGKNATQVALPPQYHYTFANGIELFRSAYTGDLALPFLTPGNNVDARGNMFALNSTPPPNSGKPAILFASSTAFTYDPNGGKSLFGATSGTCTQNGQFVINDYTVIASIGYDPPAFAYYVKTNHVSQSVYTNDPNACNVDSVGNYYYYSAGSATEALIKITRSESE